ncbi:hypothetical protein B2I21_18125 [Chryseobacterium mucoviscidosis]|uniref:hypothetical protein n=1 Tax=unclassified Paenibacillus TaxID=185978 RepID=UPI0009A3BF9D|nr:hypothetical protein [Paenibacillus sp. 11B]MDN8592871.1 hypothetical protein [Paenibacillus sp. 11B]OPG96972.1 hypothetical protein B2I21_18125 [Chryseobacterium mucoviscidosis]
MFHFIRQRKHRKKLKKVKAGDGHLLKKYRFWSIFTHSLFHIEITNHSSRNTTSYAIKSKYFAEEPRVDLYRENKHIAYSKLPAAFPVENGVIEITNNSTGINGIHYVSASEDTFSLSPDRRSIRGFRMWVHRRFPILSAFIGMIAIMILLISTALTIPQFLENISAIPWVSENIGAFESPIQLSIWTYFTIGIAAAIAGTERALMLKNHWLIDIESTHLDQ